MVHVGTKLTTLFSDRNWYNGQITQMELKPHYWEITIVYEDGDEEETHYPQNNIRPIFDEAALHTADIDLTHVLTHTAAEGKVLKAWFLAFVMKNRRLPEWQDCKNFLANDRRWPVDEAMKHCRQPASQARFHCRGMPDKEMVDQEWMLAKKEFLTLLHKTR